MDFFDEQNKIINDPSKGLKTLSQGASTTIWCATSPFLNDIGGVYCENTDIAVLDMLKKDISIESLEGEQVMHNGVMHYALEKESAEKLWLLSEELTGSVFVI